MKRCFRGKTGGLLAFLLIATLVAGGLGWATAAALQLEQEQLEARAQDQLNARLRLALWRLDSRIWPALAKEDSRPYNDYSAVYTPPLALNNEGNIYPPAALVLPSPLLSADLPSWMRLHFRVDAAGKDRAWGSPQVLTRTLRQHLDNATVKTHLDNVTQQREEELGRLTRHLKPETLLERVQQRSSELTLSDTTMLPAGNANEPAPAQQPGPSLPYGNSYKPRVGQQYQSNPNIQQTADQQINSQTEYNTRQEVRNNSQKDVQNRVQLDPWNVALANTDRNGENLFSRNPLRSPRSVPTPVHLGPMVPLWLAVDSQEERLLVARLVEIGEKQLCQGIVLDWAKLQDVLAKEVSDLFPEATFEPMREDEPPYPERTMTALPIQMNPGPSELVVAAAGWTPLRIGLALSWAAALVALLAVGLGGWSLIDLSQRRIRFVSAVTHELRTPLTTLRLYLDMLTGGLVHGEEQRKEYLQTLHTESDRLNRLVGNVLDFSRLENQRPRLEKTQVLVPDLLEQVHTTWDGRCRNADKELVLENSVGDEAVLFTDVHLVQQILGNLIDNACKYSQGAEDRRICVRARRLAPHRLALEVEDHGPGVPTRERRSIFRPFRRGHSADVTAGGVGLGLALAQRWAHLLGGQLRLQSGPERAGACFRLELPTK